MSLNSQTMHHSRAELQGTIEFLFSEGAVSAANAAVLGYLNLGNFLGAELKPDPKRQVTLSASRGVVFESGSTGAGVSLGIELTTKETADMRKAKLLLMGKDTDPFTQAAIAAAVADDMAFTAQIPAKLNHDYPILKNGVQVRHLSAVALSGGLVEGTDFLVDLELGLVRFIKAATLPAAAITPTVSAPAIDATHAKYMEGITPMAQAVRRGYGRFLVWDGDVANRLVMEMEARPIELYTSGGLTVTHDNQSEHKLTAMFRSITERWLVRP